MKTKALDSSQASAEQMEARSLGHRVELDGIRGLAVALVVLSHIGPRLLPFNQLGLDVRSVLKSGFLGVDIFFVLSGFLITTLLLGEYRAGNHIAVKKFYSRRALRLLPALFLFLAAYVIYATIAHFPKAPVIQTVWGSAFYVANWVGAFHPETGSIGTGHLWSLSIEEQFYVVWPFLVLLCLRTHTRFIGLGVIIAGIVAVAIHRIDLLGRISTYPDLFIRTDSRVDTLLVGALASWLWFHSWVPKRGMAIAATLAIPSLIWLGWSADPNKSHWYRWGFTLFAALVAVVIVAVIDTNWFGAAFFRLRPLRFLGRVSYGLYLWHLPIFKFVPDHTATWPSGTRLLLALGVTAFAVTVSWQLVERQASKYRHRFHSAVAIGST